MAIAASAPVLPKPEKNSVAKSPDSLTHPVYMQPLVSSLSPVHRLRKNFSSFLTGAQDSHLQRVTIPEAVYIQLRRRPPEFEQGNARNM